MYSVQLFKDLVKQSVCKCVWCVCVRCAFMGPSGKKPKVISLGGQRWERERECVCVGKGGEGGGKERAEQWGSRGCHNNCYAPYTTPGGKRRGGREEMVCMAGCWHTSSRLTLLM